MRQSEAMSRSQLGGCRHVRRGVFALLIALGACSSSDDAGLATAAPAPGSLEGGEVAEMPDLGAAPGGSATNEGTAGDPSLVTEAQDPNDIANVPPGPTPAAAPPVPSSGCGQPLRVSSGEQSIDVDGVPRTYLLDIPAGYDGTTPLPLVFAFHGATTSGELFRSAVLRQPPLRHGRTGHRRPSGRAGLPQRLERNGRRSVL